MRDTDDETIKFLPTPDFLEAGKFKLPRNVLKDKGSDEYHKYYSSKVEKQTAAEGQSQLSIVNYASLAFVCGLKSEQAKEYVTDMFAQLVEVNRKQSKEVKLTLKHFGYLNLYRNGELSFTHLE